MRPNSYHAIESVPQRHAMRVCFIHLEVLTISKLRSKDIAGLRCCLNRLAMRVEIS